MLSKNASHPKSSETFRIASNTISHVQKAMKYPSSQADIVFYLPKAKALDLSQRRAHQLASATSPPFSHVHAFARHPGGPSGQWERPRVLVGTSHITRALPSQEPPRGRYGPAPHDWRPHPLHVDPTPAPRILHVPSWAGPPANQREFPTGWCHASRAHLLEPACMWSWAELGQSGGGRGGRLDLHCLGRLPPSVFSLFFFFVNFLRNTRHLHT